MATITAIDLLIEAGQSAETLKEVKAALSSIKDELADVGGKSAEELAKLATAANGLQKRLDNVNKAIKAAGDDTFQQLATVAQKGAAGIQVVTAGMSLFGKESEDVQQALLKLQSIMAFTQGIEGVKGLGKEFVKLFNLLKTNPFVAIATALIAIGTAAFAAYKHFTQVSDATKELNKQYEKQKELTAQLNKEYDAQITILSAQVGKEHEVFEAKKKKLEATIAEISQSFALHKSKVQDIIDNDDLYESYLRTTEALFRKIGADEKAEQVAKLIQLNKNERAKEDLDAAKNDLNTVVQLKADLTALTITENNRQSESGKKSREEELKALSEHDQHRLDLHNEYLRKKQEAVDAELARRQQENDERLQNELDWIAAQEEANEQMAQMDAEQSERVKNESKALSDLKKRILHEDLSVAASAFGALAELSGKNAEAQKVFAAAQTTVETYLAAQKAFTSQLIPGDPTSIIRSYIAAGAAIVSGFVRVRSILATNMKSPSASSSGGGGAPNISAINQEPAGTQPTTPLDANGNPITQQQQTQFQVTANVIEGQVTAVQRRASMLQQTNYVE